MFSKILYPTDFSEPADRSLAYLKQLRQAGAEKIYILNVIHQRIIDTLEIMHKTVYFQDGRYQEDPEGALARLVAERKQCMVPLAAELEDAGYQVTTLIVEGHPVKEILKQEQETQASVIVIGSHGQNNFRRTRLGGVAEKIVRRSSVPVFIVRR